MQSRRFLQRPFLCLVGDTGGIASLLGVDCGDLNNEFLCGFAIAVIGTIRFFVLSSKLIM